MRYSLLRFRPSTPLPSEDRRAARACATVSVPMLWILVALCALFGEIVRCGSQVIPPEPAPIRLAQHQLRARKYLAVRGATAGAVSASAIAGMRRQQAKLLEQPRNTSLTGAWRPVGPLQIGSLAYGNVTGRITAIAIDPADSTGNTVYVGSTGGGVWKSTNAAGGVGSVIFTPLTDTLPVFSADSGNSAVASLSIGALSVANGVVLAGTGDPNDALDSYYGSGLLRSTDGGTTWTLVQASNDGVYGYHFFLGLGFAGFAWSTATPTTVVAAVSDAAEGTLENATSTVGSVRGLYYSTDSGVTWQMSTIKDGNQTVQSPQPAGLNQGGNAVTAVVWNPIRQRFYAAVRYHGYYESVDGSVWTRLAAQPGTGLSVAACPTNPGATGSSGCPIFRGALAVQTASGDTFAFSVDAQNLDQGIWRDVCAASNSGCASSEATFGVQLNTTSLELGGGSTEIPQGDYDLSLAAVASGSDTLVFAGTIDLYRCSLSAGCGFRNTTNIENGCSAPAMVAPAQHAISVLATSALPLLYLGNDGGLWRSADGVNEQGSPCSADDATHFQNLNGGLGSLAEVVNFSQSPSDADTLLVGVGANGTAGTGAASSNMPWSQLAAGEGGFTAIDPVTPANWYITTAPGVGISYCGKGTACAATDFAGLPMIGPAQVANDASVIDTPWLLDPSVTSNVLIGTCRAWRGPAASGLNWSSTNSLSADFGTTISGTCHVNNSFVRSLAAGGPVSNASAPANAGSELLYAGLAGTLDGGGNLGGHLFSTSAGNTAGPETVWTDLALSPVVNDAASGGVFNPSGFDVSSVVVDPHDATGNTVYATLTGFAGNGLNAPHAYRSLDGGAHWTDLTSNLPNAPANSIAVDPNDANTVYVALDTGVYVTSQISTCAASNCWSVYGTGLPNAPVIQIAASGTLPAGGASVGLLRAATYGRGIWEIPLLTAAPPVSAQITMVPNSLNFPIQAVGSTSSTQVITVTNSGTAPLVISSVATTGSFRETDNCTGVSIAVGGGCAVQVVFFPASQGTNAGTLSIFANTSSGQASATLTGIGVAPASVILNPLDIDFGLLTVGQTSSAQTVTVSNTGGVTATLQTPSVAGDFQITANTCGGNLAPGVGCSVAVVFSPTTSGTRNGVLTIADSAGTQNTSLTGVGTSVATDGLSPTALSFPVVQVVGTASATQPVTLTNTGDSALTLIAVQMSNSNFTATNGCGSSLAGHSSCIIAVASTPTINGVTSGVMTVSDQFRSQTISLSGIGTAPPAVQLSPQTLNFIGTAVGHPSANQSVQISNFGTGQLTVTSVAVSGDFKELDSCAGKTLTGSATCAVQVTFLPTAAGQRTGALVVSASIPGSTTLLQATAALTGTGDAPVSIVLDPTTANFGTVTLGSSSTPALNITISNTGGVPATLQTPAVSGDFILSANTCGATLAASTGCTVAIVFTPTAQGARTGTLSITDSAGTQTAVLSGTGTASATDGLSPLALAFAPQQVYTNSIAQAVTLTNAGNNPLTLIAVQVTGGNFTATNGCGVVLNGLSSCVIGIASSPLVVGPTSGALTVSDQFRVQTVTLSGSGLPPQGVSLSPAIGLTFAATGVGVTSTAQTVTLSNQNGSALDLSGVTASGDFSIPAAANTCGSSVAADATCTFQVVFTPTATGARTGSVTVTDNAAGVPLSIPLQGVGVDFMLNANGATRVSITSGQSAVFPLLLSSIAGLSGNVTMTCSGTPVNATCLVVPASIPLGGTTTLTATVETGVAAAASLDLTQKPAARRSNRIWWAIAVPAFLLFARPRRRARICLPELLSMVVILCLLSVTGCGSGRVIPGSPSVAASPPPTPTPSGTYPITVSATSAGLTQSVILTLVVQ